MTYKDAIKIVKKQRAISASCEKKTDTDNARQVFRFQVKLCNEIISDFKDAELNERKEKQPELIIEMDTENCKNLITKFSKENQQQKDRNIMNQDLAGKIGI